MMRQETTLLRRYSSDGVLQSIQQTPLESFLSLFLCISFSLLLLGKQTASGFEEWTRFAMTIALSWPILITLSQLSSLKIISPLLKWFISLGSLLLSASYMNHYFHYQEISHYWQYFLLLISSSSACLLSASLSKPKEVQLSFWMWRYGFRTLKVVMLSFSSAVLFFLLTAITLKIGEVFLVPLRKPALYLHLFGWSFLGFFPLAMLIQFSRPIRQSIDDSSPYIKWSYHLGIWIGVPILLFLTFLLSIYQLLFLFSKATSIKILSPLVLGVGAFGILLHFLLYPRMQAHQSTTFQIRLLKLFPLWLSFLLPLAFWALLLRIQQYGWTELRYIRLAALFFLTVLTLQMDIQYLRKKRVSLYQITLLFFISSCFCSLGPWKATSVSFRSQKGRLLNSLTRLQLLERKGMLRRKVLLSPQQPLPLRIAIPLVKERLYYMFQHYSSASLSRIFPSKVRNFKQAWLQIKTTLSAQKLFFLKHSESLRFGSKERQGSACKSALSTTYSLRTIKHSLQPSKSSNSAERKRRKNPSSQNKELTCQNEKTKL